jgi:hypothetical protein
MSSAPPFHNSQCGNLLNQTLMNPHLEGIPSLRSLTTGRLSGGNLQGLGWETYGALDSEVLGLGALDELLADFLEGGDFSACQGDADLVGFLDNIIRDVRGK